MPGAEDPVQYTENPGEGWAETYRVLNERKAGRAETPWDIVSEAMYPTAADLAAAEQDVTNPWTHVTVTTQTAAFTRTTRKRTFTVATPLDGSLKVTLRPSAGMRLGLDVFAGGQRVAHTVSAADRLPRRDGLRDAELPGAGDRTQRAWQRPARRLEALAPTS